MPKQRSKRIKEAQRQFHDVDARFILAAKRVAAEPVDINIARLQRVAKERAAALERYAAIDLEEEGITGLKLTRQLPDEPPPEELKSGVFVTDIAIDSPMTADAVAREFLDGLNAGLDGAAVAAE